MTILKKIKEDLKDAMKLEIQFKKTEIAWTEDLATDYYRAIAQKNVSRSIISMFPEIGVKPGDATDDDTIKLLKKYIGQQKEELLYTQHHITEVDVDGLGPKTLKKLVEKKIQNLGDKLTSDEVEIAVSYLPKQASEKEVEEWIRENIDFSQYKNKMQAMRPIMENFKGCDGNFIKNILLRL